MSVFRVYVEKKPGFDVEAGALLHELKHTFGISELTNIRIFNRYDVEGLDSKYIDIAKNTVFAEPQLDNIYDTTPSDYNYTLAVEPLPGQFDQRADSCAQCLQMLTCGERPLVRSARVYLLGGNISSEQYDDIRRHLINPVESMEASMELPETLMIEHPVPPPISTLKEFLTVSEGELRGFCNKYGLAMDTDDLAFCQEYFSRQERCPTLTELRVIDTYWSDHCRHTTFLTHLEDVQIEDEYVAKSFDTFLQHKKKLGRVDKPVTLMELATSAARVLEKEWLLDSLDKSEEINACSVKIKVDEDGVENDWLLMFKNETHNHPTEIEPFGGAATCIGGAIRDPLSGRSYVYQAMRVTGSGDPTVPVSQTLPGKLPQRVITTKAAKGYSSYGNQIGLATGLVREIYHPGYIAKRMEVGAVIGAAPLRNVVREVPKAGDVVILLGGRTGRDGCGGATGSSKSHNSDSLRECGAEVQKGNAPEERKIQRLFRNPDVTRMIIRCNDFGAGGVAVAVGELADGLCINLDAVPKKYSGLDGTELAISESQERMAVVVHSGDVETFITMAGEENLEATVIAEITSDCDIPPRRRDGNSSPRLVMKWNGQTIVDIEREFLDTHGTTKHAPVNVPSNNASFSKEGTRCLTAILTDLNVCSQKGLAETFDSTIGAATVLMPFGGKYQMTPTQTMAAKLPVQGAQTNTCSLMSHAYYPEVSVQNPYAAAYLAVAASIAKIIAGGGSLTRCWLSFQEYFERLGSDPERWGKPFSALLGAFQAQIDLGVAAIGGKDSMSGSFEDLDVPPTLISFAVSTASADKVISGEFKLPGSIVVLMTPKYCENGVPESTGLKVMLSDVEELISERKVLSAYVIETGGIGEAIFKMAIGNRIGFEFDEAFKDTSIFAGHNIGSIVLELDNHHHYGGGFAQDADPQFYTILGKTTEAFTINLAGETADCLELLQHYESRLESVFPTRTTDTAFDSALFCKEGTSCSRAARLQREVICTHKPRVLIPVFPGTNCEYDMAKAFTKGGAAPEILVIKNLKPSDIEDSVRALTDAINRSQIIALPGGFSGGDEPDGSGKFIVSLFRNPRIKDAIHDLLKQRDGLMCGICNGFQALIKLGLVPYGEITDTDEKSPTLTFNTIGRHQSMLVRTRIASNNSPWLANTTPGDIFNVAISHGEGRFVAPQALIEELLKNGQVATQYADMDGNPTMEMPFNPNGSMCAIEGITSPDGRVFGKMGHNERSGKDIFKNVPGGTMPPCNKNHDIFTAAAQYFKV